MWPPAAKNATTPKNSCCQWNGNNILGGLIEKPIKSEIESLCLLSSFICLLSSVLCHLSSVVCPLSSVICHLSSVFCPLSSVLCHLSTVICHLSSVLCLLSSVFCPLSSANIREHFSTTRNAAIGQMMAFLKPI